MTLAFGRIKDPHCNRDSESVLEFAVTGDRWHVVWGRFDSFGSPAYWINQTVRGAYASRMSRAVGEGSLLSETIFCLLGGFGVTAESATAAHRVVMDLLDRQPTPNAREVEEVLRWPLPAGLGRYRFPRQRSRRVAAAVMRLREGDLPTAPLALRDWLLLIDGIGPKTAAWIVRNLTGSAEVAIIDIWISRALTANGVFRPTWRIDRDYHRYEAVFLQFAAHGEVHAGALDLCIWEQARVVGSEHFART